MPKITSGNGLRNRRTAPMAEINIIPLVDVMLVLLIIFMVTTAFTKDRELGLKLPQSKSGAAAPQRNRDLTIALTRAGALYADGQKVTQAQLPALMRARLKSDPAVKVIIKGDGGVAYERVVKVMDSARQAGLTSVSLGTRTPDERN